MFSKLLTKKEAYDKELEEAWWLVVCIRTAIAKSLNEEPHKRSFVISLYSVERMSPTHDRVVSTRKFIEDWLTAHNWSLVEYTPQLDNLYIRIE